MRVEGRYFDGTVTAAQDAVLSDVFPGVRVQSAGFDRVFPFAAIAIPGRVANTPRHVRLPNGGSVTVEDNDALDALAERLQGRANETPFGQRFRRRVDRIARWLERDATGGALALAIAVTILFALHRWGVPALAVLAVEAIPPEVDGTIGEEVFAALERLDLFEESRIAAGRQRQLTATFERVRAHMGVEAELRFQRAERFGANAFALPGGTVVLTDDIVTLARHDEELVAVIAHELGHVRGRHWLKMLAQSSATLVVWSVLTGDPTLAAVVVAAPATLLELSYSRDFEREADQAAFEYMAEVGIAPSRLHDLLVRITESCGRRCEGPSWLSSHPPLEERGATAD